MAEGSDATPDRRRPLLFGLDSRTLAICACVAVLGGIVAALIAGALLQDEDTTGASDPLTFAEPTDINPIRLAAAALVAPDGSRTSLAQQMDERPMLLNVWAKTCVPCVKEMPLLEEVSQANPEVAFFGVTTDRLLADAEGMVRQTGITYPWAQDETGAFAAEVLLTVQPLTLLLDTNGTVLATRVGEFTSRSQLQGWMDEHLS